MKHSLSHACIVLALAGCGSGSGFLRDATTANQHQYRQEVGTVTYLRSASGSSSAGSIFCAIPVETDGQYKTAMQELHAQAKLQPNQVLENLREDHITQAYFFFYCVSTLTLSADVVELRPVGAPPPSLATTSQPAPAQAQPACELAYAQLPRLAAPLKRLYPNADLAPTPPAKSRFIPACFEQPDDVQSCLQASFLESHLDACKDVFESLPPRARKRLFLTFLTDFE